MCDENRGGSNYISNIGQKFGRLLVIEKIDNYRNKKNKSMVKYRCLCDCGNFVDVLKISLTRGVTKSCGCLQKEIFARKSWKGCGEISGRNIGIIKRAAKKRNIEYNLSNEFLWDLFLKQDRKCALTGKDMVFARDCRRIGELQTASLDRIDSSKGYIEGNVWWVHKDINRLKFDWTLEELYRLCEDIINFRQNNINKEDNDRLKR